MTEEKEKKAENMHENIGTSGVEYDLEEDELGIEQYIKPRWQQTRFWMWVILGIVFVLMVFIFKTSIIDKTIPPKDLVAAIQIFNIRSQWVVSEKIDSPDFKGIVLVPEITFQVRNAGKVDLSYVYMLGVFSLYNSPKSLGEGFVMAFKDPLKPDAVSAPINLRSQFGYKATSKQAFLKHAKEWKKCTLKILVKSGSSGLSPLKELYFISRKIEGMDIEINLTGQSLNEINPQLGKPEPKPDIKPDHKEIK